MRKILLNWYYERSDLTDYLLDFSDKVELVFLYRQFSVVNPSYLDRYKNISIVYWSDYKTPQQLLRFVKPDCVVLCDLESFNQIALNIAARNNGITTYVLQHGLRGAFEVEEASSKVYEPMPTIQVNPTSWWSLRFFFSSLKFKNFRQLPVLLKFMYARKTKELTLALKENQFELRRADYYIEFTQENAGYHKLRDGVPDNRFIFTGNPLYDDYTNYGKNKSSLLGEKYFLLIDCPFMEGSFLTATRMNNGEKNSYILSMNELSKSVNAKLYVKLHPLTYSTKNLPSDSNLIYFRETDIIKLAAAASLIFFVHFSTLSPLLLSFKSCIYFNSHYLDHADVFKRLSVTTFNIFPFTCTAQDLDDKVFTVNREELQKFIYKNDGKAGQRIKSILQGQQASSII